MVHKLAFVFPGQGGQAAGMGKDLYDNFDCSRKLFDQADEILGSRLSSLCFEGPEEELVRTVNTQPALFVTSAAAHAALIETGEFRPFVTAGHSVGEYAALYAAGALKFEDALCLVRRRGELMQMASEQNPGTMAAIIGLDADGVRKALEMSQDAGIVDAANFNSPGQVVISGEVEAVSKAGEAALALGAKRVIPLKVGGAFHSRLMKSAAEGMMIELYEAPISEPEVPIVANVSAEFVRAADGIRQALAKQVMGSVLWEDSVRKMVECGVTGFVELGAGTTLAGMIKRIVPDVPTASIGDKASLEEFLEIVASA
jgi:[acyl-carrier-protein] S-malonyltransferase